MIIEDGVHEVFEGDVQYPYADVGRPEMLHISAVKEENRRDYKYTCPYCKKELRPRLGAKNRHCFAHRKGESCELDRYIHTTAERLLKEKWDRDEPFEICMNVKSECVYIRNCIFYRRHNKGCVSEEMKTFDLKKQYNRCEVEKKYGDFIPDLCLYDDTGHHDPIFIEIWSKHKNSDAKASSKHKIIEIRLRTVAEMEELPKHPITESESVTFSHFKTLSKKPAKDDGPRLMRYFLYANTYKSFVDYQSVNCTNYKSKHQSKSIFEVVCSQDDIYTPKEFHNYCNAIAIDRGYDIRNCYLCRQYGEDKSKWDIDLDWNQPQNRPIGCRREIKTQGLLPCKPDDARSCPLYKVKDYPLKRLIEVYSDITRYIWYRDAEGTAREEVQKRSEATDYSVIY